MRRYAIYYAPEPGSELAAFGAQWLGRDPETGATIEQPVLLGVRPERLAEITAAPRLYGFHGTLKAPMHLARGRDPDALRRLVRDLAGRHRPFEIDLVLASIVRPKRKTEVGLETYECGEETIGEAWIQF